MQHLQHLAGEHEAYGRGHVVAYLLRAGCWQLHGGKDLSPEGRVAQRVCPTTCDYAEVDATRFARAGLPRPGPLRECIHCNRWICQRCGRDDGPLYVCRECPELLKARGSLGGRSVLDPTCAKMPQADPKGVHAGAKGTGGESSRKLQQTYFL